MFGTGGADMLKKKVWPKKTMPRTIAEKRVAAKAAKLDRVLKAFVATVDEGSYRGDDMLVIEDWLTYLSTRLKQIYELARTPLVPTAKGQTPIRHL
jgi:hypothetical protein